MITTTNPATGARTETRLRENSPADVAALADQAHRATEPLARRGRAWRAGMLEAIAGALETDRDTLVHTATRETGLPEARLTGELARAAFQFRMFAEALREGSYLEASIDHAGETPLGPGPDLRRMLIPIGPVAVFGASNFPFAFSVAGGDTASALAAGCPVMIKAHDSHPLTSLASLDAIKSGLESCGAPDGTAALIFGQPAASAMISHPLIRAVSFTGSLQTAKKLMHTINQREDPIPFYGELSSINPLIISEGAARARPTELGEGLFASVTGSGGQLCTKPGIAFVPTGEAGDRVVATLTALTESSSGHVLLNERIASSYRQISRQLVDAGADVAARGSGPRGDGFVAEPVLLTTTAASLGNDLAQECFGPLVVVARYSNLDEVVDACDRMPPSLTATVHAEDGESDIVERLSRELLAGAGRLVFNGYPTGVRVCWGQHHGGPWPATNSQHTSVGVSAIRRFLRPFAWQNAPEPALPEELRDDYASIPRRIDGRLTVPDAPEAS